MAMFYSDDPVFDAQRYDQHFAREDRIHDLAINEWIYDTANAEKVGKDDWLSWMCKGTDFEETMIEIVGDAMHAKYSASNMTIAQKDELINKLFAHIKVGAIAYAEFETGE